MKKSLKEKVQELSYLFKLTENKEGFTLLLINVNNEILKTDKFKTLNELQKHLFKGLETDNIITG